ncbi:MAG: MotA/TolQ/ExbB proton channel family protein [Verrucomicrobiae bacterium]|nr:MotA/TolQ/ExbB proton channel family protein [Verrucomicrobiae bacterium]
MKFVCPNCNIHLQAEADLAGKTVKCPGCSTKIQIPEDLGQSTGPQGPPPPDAANAGGSEGAEDAAGEEQASPGEEMAGDYYDQMPELEMGQGPAGPHPSYVNMWLAGLLGLGLTFFWYLIMFMLPKPNPEEGLNVGSYLRALFTERAWPQYVTTLLTFWCLGILIFKMVNLRKQRRAMLIEALPEDIDSEINAGNLIEFHQHVLNFPKPLRNTYIINRIRKALEFFYIRQNNPEVAQMISSQSEVDANKVAGSYALVKVFLWAIPIMGFIGTVLGIGNAIGGFGDVLKVGDGGDMGQIVGALTPVLGSMGVAFDTTLLALVFSILLSFPASGLQNSEDDLVTNVDEYCIDNLLKRLNDGGAASNFSSEGALLKAIGDAIATNQKDFLHSFEDVQRQMSDNLDGQTKNYEKVASVIDKQLASIENRTEHFEKRVDLEMVRAMEKMTEGVKNLNGVLKELNGKQVVIKKKGWFSRGD